MIRGSDAMRNPARRAVVFCVGRVPCGRSQVLVRPSSLCLVPPSHETRDDQALRFGGVEGLTRHYTCGRSAGKKPMLLEANCRRASAKQQR